MGELIGKTQLNYSAGGAGRPGNVDEAAWTPVMGRYWSHTFAQRIILDPDETHVWLITEGATYREYGNLVAGVYETLRPSNDYRTLRRTGTGWELKDLDGTVVEFDGAGQWISTTDRNGNITAGSYTGSDLTEVSLPDKRLEQFGYTSGRLTSVKEIGIDGSEREWVLGWTGDDLTRLDRPDGTAWVMSYDDPTFPGYMTLLQLEGTDGSLREVTGWKYDDDGNVMTLWSGGTSPDGADAVDVWSFAFDDPAALEVTTVTDPLGQVTTYEYDRDPQSDRTRLRSISGDCPGCGLAPNTTFAYTDSANPMLPTSMTDGEMNTTSYIYDGKGRMLTRTELVGTSEARTTTWSYDPGFPDLELVETMSRPSVEAGQSRETIYTRDASGNARFREIRGYEAGQPFDCTVSGAPCYQTEMSYNTAGQVETIDPPGYASGDVTSYTYETARGNLIPHTRIDPLIGTTTYGHDGYHRRTSVTDVNGVVTTTEYDLLDRVVKVTRLGPDDAVEADDLITEHEYNAYGDLQHTILPERKYIVYEYDDAGRLKAIERRPDATTKAERTFFTLDAAGNRTREDLQRWDTGLADWVTESTTSYLYSSRCHVDQVLHPDGTVTEYDYDCNGNLTHTWDAKHPSAGKTNPATAVYGYDGLDRLTTVTRPWAGGGASTTSYHYDVQDHLTQVTDAEGSVTTYTYSDRDLLTQEVSPVSGTTTHTYNAHGELESTTDDRGITETRVVDQLDRVTEINYPDTTLNTTYDYGTEDTTFEVGRLTGITRDSHTEAYAYDRFGRTTQDGDLTFAYDKNGNRTQIGYPGGVTADYTFDHADREDSLSVTTPAGTTDVVTGATYLPSGPLATLTFGTGAREDRAYTSRYFPDVITLTATQGRTWTYATDAVGNPTQIVEAVSCPGDLTLANATLTTAELYESCAGITAGPSYTVANGGGLDLQAATRIVFTDGFRVESGGTLSAGINPTLDDDVTKTYVYQDVDYFLTSATGPWGAQSWTYDKIGNRLTETDNGATDQYNYVANGAGGNTARLSSIDLSTLGTRSYTYTDAGHVDDVTAGANVVDFTWDDAGRLSHADRSTDTAAFAYDGRGFLHQGGDAAGPGTVLPTYDSSGLLHCLQRQVPTGTTTYHHLYLAGRPVGQVAIESGQPERWWYFTTDHLGTPVVATDSSQDELWLNRFDPFGEDPFAGTTGGASEQEVFVRFPGQWDDPVWRDAMMGADGYYNVNRWYTPSTGRYTRTDPLGRNGDLHPYLYGLANPLNYIDPLGLKVRVCCKAIPPTLYGSIAISIQYGLKTNYKRHCFFEFGDSSTVGLHGPTDVLGIAGAVLCQARGEIQRRDRGERGFDQRTDLPSSCSPWNDCGDECVNEAVGDYPKRSKYCLFGPNSNTFAGSITRKCGLSPPPADDVLNAPGWFDGPPD